MRLANCPNWPVVLPVLPAYKFTRTFGIVWPSAPVIVPPDTSVTKPLSGRWIVVSFVMRAFPMASAASAA